MQKYVSLMLVLLMALGSAVPIFGAEAQSQGLEKAILIVKNAVTIPADYKEFEYSSYQTKFPDEEEFTVWDLNWSTEDGKSSISASVDSMGNLNNLWRYEKSDNSGLAKVDRATGQKTAAAFLAKAMPKLAGSMKLVNEQENQMMTYALGYTYQLYVNGIPAPFIQANISVDKYTGTIASFTGLAMGQKVPSFPEAKTEYTAEQLEAIYEEKLGAELRYYINYDYEKKALSTFAGYSMEKSINKALDAVTGEVVKLYREDRFFVGGMGEGENKDAASAGAQRLSPEELAAISAVSGLISKEEAESILRKAADGISASQKVNNASLSRDYQDKEQYLWSISFEGAWGTVDAASGEVLSFYLYEDSLSGRSSVTTAQAASKAEAIAKKLSPEKYAKTKPVDTENPETQRGEEVSYYFFYNRQENGIPVNGEGISVVVNSKTGQISSYNCDWTGKVSFPDMTKAMTSEAAFKQFNKTGNLGLAYQLVDKEKVALVSDFSNSVTSFLLDPISGEKLDWNGERYQKQELPEYTDIKGHWAEKTIMELRNNGYYLEGTQFKPDSAINQESFLRYLYSDRQAGYNQEAFYKMLEREKILLAGEKAPDKAITRQESAKFMVRYLGLDIVAKKTNIFTNLFKDKVDSSYKGYAAICYGLEIMQGDEKGRFGGAKTMTRAEAACALYQLIESQ